MPPKNERNPSRLKRPTDQLTWWLREYQWMRASMDESINGWEYQWMRVSMDESINGWEYQCEFLIVTGLKYRDPFQDRCNTQKTCENWGNELEPPLQNRWYLKKSEKRERMGGGEVRLVALFRPIALTPTPTPTDSEVSGLFLGIRTDWRAIAECQPFDPSWLRWRVLLAR